MNSEQPKNAEVASKDAPENSEKLQQKRIKKKGPKPSSKKRLEEFRLQKSRETVAEIHRAALERTSISLDKLISCMAEMQIIAQKQEVVVPVTTRGAGLLTTESYDEAILTHPKAKAVCSVNSAYRVVLAQEQLQLSQSERNSALDDPVVESMDKQSLHLDCNLAQQVASTPQSFRLTADLVNSIGKFEFQQTKYRPMVRSPYVGTPDHHSPKRTRRSDDIIPDPYTVTFSNLRATVVALSNPTTPLEWCTYFRDNNPIPGAVFSLEGRLVNAETIMPAIYDIDSLAMDQRRFRSFLGIISGKSPQLVGECTFNGNGNPAQLVSVVEEKFKINEHVFHPSGATRFRCIRQLEPQYIIRGALGLLGEVPRHRANDPFYGIRAPPWHEQYIDVSWAMLVGRALSR